MSFVDDVRETIAQAILVSAPYDPLGSYITGVSDPRVWFTGANKECNIDIPVPKDADFEATRMNIYLASRLFDQDNPENAGTELTYRPASWTCTNNPRPTAGVAKVQDADATFVLSDTHNGPYQGSDTPLPLSAAFSGRYGQGGVVEEALTSAYPGGLDFTSPQHYRRGTTVNLKVQGTFSRLSDEIIKTEFRVLVVFTGKKLIRRSL